MVLNKKVFRTMLDNKSKYIGCLVLIILSCMLYSSFNIAMANVTKNLDMFREKNIQEDANFITAVSVDNVEELEDKYNFILEERKSFDFKRDDTVLRVLETTEKINLHSVVDGEELTENGQVLIDKSFGIAQDLKINDSIKIEGKDFKITGYMTAPDYIYVLKSEGDLLKNPDAFGVAIISEEDMKDINKGNIFYSIKFNEDNEEDFKEEINKSFPIINWLDKKDNNRISFIDQDLKGGVEMGKTLPLAILVLTCVLLAVVMWRLLKIEFNQIGILYSFGYRKNEIMMHYLSYALILSVLGSFIGTGLGIISVKPLLKVVTAYYNLPVLVTVYDITYYIISLILPFVFLIPITIIVVYQALKLSPVILIKGGDNKQKVGFFENKIKLNKFSFNTKFKIREIARNVPRTLLMIFGVALASMFLLMGFATKDSMDYLVYDSYTNVYTYEYDYMFNSFQTEKISNGDVINLSQFSMANNEDKNFIIYGVGDDTEFINLKNREGKPLSFNKTIITKSLAEKLKIQKGSKIEVKNNLNLVEFKVEIDDIADVYIGDFIYMPIDKFNKENGYPKGSYLQILSDKKMNIEDNKLLTSNSKDDIISGYASLIKPLQYMLVMISVFSFVIALIIIYIVTSLLIEENKSTISMLKVFGYRKREIHNLILKSNTILVVVGYLISIPVLLYSMEEFFKEITKEMNITIPSKLNNVNILIGFIIILFAYNVAKFFNKRKIEQISLTDTLKLKSE